MVPGKAPGREAQRLNLSSSLLQKIPAQAGIFILAAPESGGYGNDRDELENRIPSDDDPPVTKTLHWKLDTGTLSGEAMDIPLSTITGMFISVMPTTLLSRPGALTELRVKGKLKTVRLHEHDRYELEGRPVDYPEFASALHQLLSPGISRFRGRRQPHYQLRLLGLMFAYSLVWIMVCWLTGLFAWEHFLAQPFRSLLLAPCVLSAGWLLWQCLPRPLPASQSLPTSLLVRK